MLTRVNDARDLACGGLRLAKTILGKGTSLQVHHIFPKALLYKAGYKQGDVNAIANFCYLTQCANLEISARLPADYFASADETIPGALESQWIPTDVALRSVESYFDFLEMRRALLAEAANTFLDSLLTGPFSTPVAVPSAMPGPIVEGAPETDLDGEVRPGDIDDLVGTYDIAEPVRDFLVEHPQSGDPLGVADLAWPDGLQAGYSEPVALVMDGQPVDIDAIQAVGYRVFKTLASIRQFLEKRSRELIGFP